MNKTYPTNGKTMLEQCGKGVLKAVDIAVFWALSVHVTATGRAHMKPTVLAKKMGMSRTTVYASIRRLEDNLYVVQEHDDEGGGTYFLLNPLVRPAENGFNPDVFMAQFVVAVGISF